MSTVESGTRAPAPAPSRARTRLLIVLAAGAIGAVTVGVLSRLMMFVLFRLNPEVDGIESDDGFEMGRFTVSGSLNLLLAGIAFGLLSGLLFLAFERLMFGPAWFRTLSLAVGAGAVPAAQLVHSDGVDFTLLEPLWLTVSLFVALPVLHIALVERAAVRIRAARGSVVTSAGGPVAWVLRAALVVVFVLAVAALVSDIRALA